MNLLAFNFAFAANLLIAQAFNARFAAADVATLGAAVAVSVAGSFANYFPRSKPFCLVFPLSSIVRWGLYAGFTG